MKQSLYSKEYYEYLEDLYEEMNIIKLFFIVILTFQLILLILSKNLIFLLTSICIIFFIIYTDKKINKIIFLIHNTNYFKINFPNRIFDLL